MFLRFKKHLSPLMPDPVRKTPAPPSYDNSPEPSPLTATIVLVVFPVLRQGGADHNRALDTFFLHLTADVVCIGDAAVEIEGVRRTSAAAVKPCKTVLTFFLRVYIAELELIANLRINYAGIHVSKQKIFVPDKLVARI